MLLKGDRGVPSHSSHSSDSPSSDAGAGAGSGSGSGAGGGAGAGVLMPPKCSPRRGADAAAHPQSVTSATSSTNGTLIVAGGSAPIRR